VRAYIMGAWLADIGPVARSARSLETMPLDNVHSVVSFAFCLVSSKSWVKSEGSLAADTRRRVRTGHVDAIASLESQLCCLVPLPQRGTVALLQSPLQMLALARATSREALDDLKLSEQRGVGGSWTTASGVVRMNCAAVLACLVASSQGSFG
jgi:hypothetical protein